MVQSVDNLSEWFVTLQKTLSPSILGGQAKALTPGDSNCSDSDTLAIKDQIVSSVLGSDFKQFIDAETGHWENPNFVILNFQ
jgi:hypothetical protein